MKKKMKTKIWVNLWFAVVISVILFSCSGRPKTEETSINEPIEEVVEEKNPHKESFDLFFEEFAKDSVFQLSRVSFPISYYSIDIEDNKQEYVYNKDDFWHLDFVEDNEAAERAVDAYEPVLVRESPFKIKYIKKGIDNGIRIEYFFEMNDNGDWNLIKIIDYSN